jgi:hypothetical protein
MFVKFVCWLLRRKTLSTHDSIQLTNTVLERIGSFPTHAIITVDGGKILIRGTPLEREKAIVIRESARQALNNIALREVHEQVLYNAIAQSLHSAQNFEQTMFGKAAVWYGQQEIEILKQLASEGTTELLGYGD